MEYAERPTLPHKPTRSVSVTSNELIAPEVYAIRFRRGFDFTPGQVVSIAVDPRLPDRFYSIASGTEEPEAMLLYDLVPEGELTPRLSLLEPGDELFVSDPFGTFIDRHDSTWWIATGTGIAPFLSMARSGSGGGKMLVHGGRTLDRFYFHDELSSLLEERYLCCCSRERSAWTFPGRLTTWLMDRAEPPVDVHYMLCGNAGMVVEVRDILIARGVPFGNVAAEIYF